MSELQVLEGTWEELSRYADKFGDKKLRLLILSEESGAEPAHAHSRKRKRVSALGKYAHLPGSSEDYALEKQKEIEREDREFA